MNKTWNLDTEQSILGAVLTDNRKVPDVLEWIGAQHFSKHAHQKIFEAVAELYEANQPIDLTNLLNQKASLKVVGSAAYLESMMDVPVDLRKLKQHVRIVRENSCLQSLIRKITNMGYQDELD